MGRCFLLVVLCLTANGVYAAEYARMVSGSRMRIAGYENAGGALRLFLEGGGSVDVAAGSVTGFEKDEYTPPPPAQPSSPVMRAALSGGLAQEPAGELVRLVKETGSRHGMDPDLIYSVIRAESGGNPRAVSRKGARGLMQLMPGTAREYNVRNAFDPAQNIDGGTRYLRYLMELHGNNVELALAAYNAGPKRVAAYGGIPPFRETRDYVSRILRFLQVRKQKR